jgi:hypothetical protein
MRADRPPEQARESWRLDAFSDLSPGELAVFNGLRTAALDIQMMHEEDGLWPTIDALEEAAVPPFNQDVVWHQSGRMVWSRSIIATEARHIALYLGSPLLCDQGRSLLLVMMHDHVRRQGNVPGRGRAPYEIWLHPACAPDIPDALTDQALITAGWYEVVARTGAIETRHTKGAEFMQ